MAAINQRGHLIVGVDENEYQLGFRDAVPLTQSGEPYEGFDIDVVHTVAEAIFGGGDTGAQRIEFVPVSQDYQIGAAYQGLVDVVADSVDIGCAPLSEVRHSVDYIDSGPRLLVRRSDESDTDLVDRGNGVPLITGLGGSDVCTVGSPESFTNLAALQSSDHFRIMTAGNWSDCLLLLQQGSVKALYGDSTILTGLQAEDPYLAVVGDGPAYQRHGLVFPPSDPSSPDNSQFVSFVNAVIAQVESAGPGYCPQPRTATDPTCWAALYRTWFAPQASPPAPPAPVYLK
jgi:polar amino acid transport system substrate-binding protein